MVTRRLEAATSRLEDMATSVDASHADTVAAINNASATPAEPAAATITEPPPQPAQPLPRSIEAFDKIIKEDVQGFVTASEKIGGLVEQQVEDLRNSYNRRS
jgi:adenylyl cyclase-associated protein